MLRNYLTTIPYSKVVLIEDNIHERGKPIFDFLLKNHSEKSTCRIHYIVFQETFGRVKSRLINNNIVLYDCSSNTLGWNKELETQHLKDIVKNVGNNDVIFIDSLAHTIYEYGLAETYRILNDLKCRTGVLQIVALLHQDLLEDKFRIHQLLEHLSTFSISLQPRFMSENKRLQYIYKKLGGKIIKEVEEYWLEGENLYTRKIEKPDPKQLLEKSVPPEINPDTLSTFKIGLSDADKKSREGLVLPYLPKPEGQNEQESGKIFYQFDEVDDWDEEDPDDDLDI